MEEHLLERFLGNADAKGERIFLQFLFRFPFVRLMRFPVLEATKKKKKRSNDDDSVDTYEGARLGSATFPRSHIIVGPLLSPTPLALVHRHVCVCTFHSCHWVWTAGTRAWEIWASRHRFDGWLNSNECMYVCAGFAAAADKGAKGWQSPNCGRWRSAED